MQSVREILNTIIPVIRENLDENGNEILNEIENLMSRADFRRKYYRLQLWDLINELRDTNPDLNDVIGSLLNDLAKKWELTLAKALNEGKL